MTRHRILPSLTTLCILLASSLTAHAEARFLSPDFGVGVTTDILYGTGATGFGPLDLFLDFYEPIDIGTPVPATSPGILYIHGVSFIGGDKADGTAQFMSNLYASYGYRVLSINYRLAGDLPPNDTGPPANLAVELNPLIWPAVNAGYNDSLTAMNYMLDNAASFDIDPSRWAIAGHSAGAGLALAEAYFDPAVSGSPRAVLDFMGGLAGGESAITAPLPPAFIVHDPADMTAPFSWPANLSMKLTELGVYHELWQPTNGHTLNQDTMDEVMPNGKTLLENNMIFLATELSILADLDIKPGSDPNSINLKSRGVLPVALLSTDDFDALDVDVETILFGDPLLLDDGGTGVSPLRSAEKDVNGDGLTDLTLKFSMRDLVDNGALGGMSMEAILTGLTTGGMMFEASDSIRLVPPGDANNDLVVDVADYTAWANGFDTNGAKLSDGDFNEDNKVDAADYILWAENFGSDLSVSAPQSAVAAVPEPSTFAIALCGLLGLFAYGWRRRRRA